MSASSYRSRSFEKRKLGGLLEGQRYRGLRASPKESKRIRDHRLVRTSTESARPRQPKRNILECLARSPKLVYGVSEHRPYPMQTRHNRLFTALYEDMYIGYESLGRGYARRIRFEDLSDQVFPCLFLTNVVTPIEPRDESR